jgi:hypothetical protein
VREVGEGLLETDRIGSLLRRGWLSNVALSTPEHLDQRIRHGLRLVQYRSQQDAVPLVRFFQLDWITWSRAVWSVVLKQQRSGSVPGRDSAASTITVRRA